VERPRESSARIEALENRSRLAHAPEDTGSVTALIQQLQSGNEDALQGIYERYEPYLLGLARRRIPQHLRGRVDEEDVVQEVWIRFFDGVRSGQLTAFASRDHLFRYLSDIARWRIIDLIRFNTSQKRGLQHPNMVDEVSLDQVVDPKASGEEDVQLAEELQ